MTVISTRNMIKMIYSRICIYRKSPKLPFYLFHSWTKCKALTDSTKINRRQNLRVWKDSKLQEWLQN